MSSSRSSSSRSSIRSRSSRTSSASSRGTSTFPDGASLESQSSSSLSSKHVCHAKTLLVMRHGERTDDMFPGWIQKSTRSGRYVPYDLNMPRELNSLHRPMPNFHMDTPLTMLGSVLAQFVGRAMNSIGNAPDVIYASPALRCVQTAQNAALFAHQNPLIRVEPGLFENTDLYPDGRPKLMTREELRKAGFNIDMEYESLYDSVRIFENPESNWDYNRRIQKTLQMIVDREELMDEEKKLNVLVCAHASTVDMAVGHFVYERRMTLKEDLIGIADRIPYSSFSFFTKKRNGNWELDQKKIPFVTYEHFTSRYDTYFIHRRTAEAMESSRSTKKAPRKSDYSQKSSKKSSKKISKKQNNKKASKKKASKKTRKGRK